MGEFVDPFSAEERPAQVRNPPRQGSGARVPAMTWPELRRRELAEKDPRRRDAGIFRTKNHTREAWVEQGRALGEAEALSRRESPADRKDRVARAMAYAAWEWDGKPQGYGDRYRLEFGYSTPTVLLSFDRPPKDAA